MAFGDIRIFDIRTNQLGVRPLKHNQDSNQDQCRAIPKWRPSMIRSTWSISSSDPS